MLPSNVLYYSMVGSRVGMNKNRMVQITTVSLITASHSKTLLRLALVRKYKLECLSKDSFCQYN